MEYVMVLVEVMVLLEVINNYGDGKCAINGGGHGRDDRDGLGEGDSGDGDSGTYVDDERMREMMVT